MRSDDDSEVDSKARHIAGSEKESRTIFPRCRHWGRLLQKAGEARARFAFRAESVFDF